MEPLPVFFQVVADGLSWLDAIVFVDNGSSDLSSAANPNVVVDNGIVNFRASIGEDVSGQYGVLDVATR